MYFQRQLLGPLGEDIDALSHWQVAYTIINFKDFEVGFAELRPSHTPSAEDLFHLH